MGDGSPTARSGLRIRFMDPEDLPFVIAEHLGHFPDGFFARLGPKFLAAYTRTYLTGPDVPTRWRPTGSRWASSSA